MDMSSDRIVLPKRFRDGEFCTPVGLAEEYKKLIVDVAKSNPEDYFLNLGRPDADIRAALAETELGAAFSSRLHLGSMQLTAAPHPDGRYGGRFTRLINDVLVDPLDTYPRKNVSPPNTCFVTLSYDGWRYGFVVATETIQEFSQLGICYGDGYWRNREHRFRQTSQMDTSKDGSRRPNTPQEQKGTTADAL